MSEWQPIETAPKDGTNMLGFCVLPHSGVIFITTIWWAKTWRDFVPITGIDEHDELFDAEPGEGFTHWMPLPDPPQ